MRRVLVAVLMGMGCCLVQLNIGIYIVGVITTNFMLLVITPTTSSHKQQDQRQYDPGDSKGHPLFKDTRLRHEHPEGGDHEKEK